MPLGSSSPYRQQQQLQFGRFRQQQPLFSRNGRIQAPFAAQVQQEYGPPQPSTEYGPPPPTTTPPPSVTDDGEDESETDEDGNDQPVVAVANAASGQYYILGRDNTLQRVAYVTTQTEDDKLHEGFTAQLRYAPVEPIRDPIYAYDAQGQLVRLYNKK